MNFSRIFIAGIVAAFSYASVYAQKEEHSHSDILVASNVQGTSLTTGGYKWAGAENPVVTPPVRVFGYDFGENYADPFFVEDPGFVAVPGTFAAGTKIYFDVQDELKYWDGTGEVNFGLVPSGESLQIVKGSNYVTIGSGGTWPMTGLLLGETDGSTTGQQLHEHFDAYLLGADGNATPASDILDAEEPHDVLIAGDGIEASTGIYLLKLTLRSDGLADSAPFWIVYNAGMGEDIHHAAVEYVESNLAPEPASFLTLAMAGMALLRRRRGFQLVSSGS